MKKNVHGSISHDKPTGSMTSQSKYSSIIEWISIWEYIHAMTYLMTNCTYMQNVSEFHKHYVKQKSQAQKNINRNPFISISKLG